MIHPGPFDALDDLSPDDLRARVLALQSLIERAPVPIAIAHDPECRYISGNRAAAALVGLDPDVNISLTPADGSRPPYRIQRNGVDVPPAELPMQYAIAQRTSVSNDIEIVRADGTVLYVRNDVEPLYDTHGNIYGCVSVIVDVTDHKLSEMSLISADRRKDEFLATLSHELRNPLAPIRTALEVMRLARNDADVVEKARATMERQLTHLVRITDDLLDIARITQNKVELRRERIDLRAAILSAVETTRPLVEAQQQSLDVELPPQAIWLEADFTRLAQVFSNLLSNAAKYTDRGGQIRVSAAAGEGEVAVSVSDTGIGIAADNLPRVFEMFTQLQPHRDRTHGGLGIGLTLARRLVELHGGTIAARSEGPGRGSTFTVTLPATMRAAHADRVRTPSGEIAGQCRVLLAEDNADAAEMMRVMLTFGGHDVCVARDGVEAVAIAETFDPQIAFLDIGMPRMDGYEAARRIRARLGSRIMLVALTGWGQDEDKRLSREAGFDHHLTKPPEPDVVEELIARCARGRTRQ
jgi:PAS domain S-box-containing protein